ncbi:MAG TPA: hypothetical protein PKD83_12225 [Ignavibacteria bacterium]|nr:hypothetical protein [Ignavibacteria bacterium]
MSERIIIEFDDEEKKKKDEEKIVISFDESEETDADKTAYDIPETKEEEVKEIEIQNITKPEETIVETSEEKIKNSKVNSCFRGNQHLSGFYQSEIKFPEGIENSFRKKFSLNLSDEFFNTILENNRNIILSSRNGYVYFIDRFSGMLKGNLFFENESFEKTGLVYENRIFVNSLTRITEINDEDLSKKEIYRCNEDSYIWGSLNRIGDRLVLLEYNYHSKQAALKIIDLNENNAVREFLFKADKFVIDKICIANNCVYVLFDSNLLEYDLDRMSGSVHSLNMKNEAGTDESSFIFYLNYKLFITSRNYEIYYSDLPGRDHTFKFTGIKSNYMNSTGGFDDNLFTGTPDGWRFYKISGLPVYMYEDEYENKIECISRNIIVVSQKNKIVFCNLNRFQEAEGFVISSDKNKESVEIISSVISGNEIFVLTKNGILEAFTNDKFNIHI